MSRWKQAGLAAAIVIVTVLAWARISPDAGAWLGRLGLAPSLVAVLTGASGNGEDGQTQGGRQAGRGEGASREVLVVTAPVTSARINDRVTAIGDGEAVRSVTVVPLSAGVLTHVNVSAGDQVEAGAVLAELDSELEEIERDRAALAVELAREKLGRYERLMSSSAASEVQLNEARNEFDNARLALRDAELTLKRRSIIAPIGGIVGIIPVEVGDYVTTQAEIATLDDRSQILVDFWVPERFAASVIVGQQVEAVPIALPGEEFSGAVAEIASRVDRESRTLQVRARLDNPRDRLRPGMSFRVTLRFAGDSFPAVNPLAVQWSSQGAFVWKEKDGLAVRTPVRIVQRNSDTVLVDGELAEGEATVIEGVQTLRDGVRLRVAGDAGAPAPAAGS